MLASLGWLTHDALAIRTALTAARAELASSRTALLTDQLDRAATQITAAGRQTARAAGYANDPLLRLVAGLPGVGRTPQVARSLALTADAVTRDLLPAVLAAARQLRPGSLRLPGGAIDVARLQRAGPALAALSAQAHALDRSGAQLPRRFVLGPVGRGRTSFSHELAQIDGALRAARTAVAVAPSLLGADRPRHYFVLIQQTSESRGTGGLPGGFAIVQAQHGRLSVTAQGSDRELRNGPVAPPPGVPADYRADYAADGAFDLWQNVNLSPDLPVVARVVAARWRAQSGQAVDGVVALDASALADLLRGSGPLSVGGSTLAPAQLPAYLAVGQYQGLSPTADQGARKDRLVLIARRAADRLTAGSGSPGDLLRGLIAAVRSGHLRMASDDPALHDALHAAGVDGALPAGTAPTAYPVVYNSAGGKLDYFLDRSIAYTAGPCHGTRRLSRITVTLRNSAPPAGLPPYLTILIRNGLSGQSYDGLDTLLVYGTRGAQLVSATLDGQPVSAISARPGGTTLVTTTEGGLPVWFTYLSLPRGRARRLVLIVNEPAVPGSAVVPVQPLPRPLGVAVAVPRCG
ncbi:MAG: DUF4012 domain-containing protein [Mycobacteriales bacterium]